MFCLPCSRRDTATIKRLHYRRTAQTRTGHISAIIFSNKELTFSLQGKSAMQEHKIPANTSFEGSLEPRSRRKPTYFWRHKLLSYNHYGVLWPRFRKAYSWILSFPIGANWAVSLRVSGFHAADEEIAQDLEGFGTHLLWDAYATYAAYASYNCWSFSKILSCFALVCIRNLKSDSRNMKLAWARDSILGSLI